MIKVSVVVPTYAPGDRINRVIDSIDSQTMPIDEFEMIFVDDGSPDDTLRRLREVQSSRSNVVVHSIPNSGWPSTPRNVGLELARGEYVLFLDHDDELYPDSLRVGYAYAKQTDADVLNGKEARTDQAKWAIETYPRNIENAFGRTDVPALAPTNPHKLYRRSLLMDHNIRFPVGRRQIWEDVFFNIDVARHARRIAVLADTPFYHWFRQGVTSSDSYGADLVEWWNGLFEIFRHTNRVLEAAGDAAQRAQMNLYQYRARLLPALTAGLHRRSIDDQRFAFDTAHRIVGEYLPEVLDVSLPRHMAARAFLVRNGTLDQLRILNLHDVDITGISYARAATWGEDGIEVRTRTVWTANNGGFLDLVRDGDLIKRSLSPELAGVFPDDLLDVTLDLHAATSQFGLRSRRDKMTWMQPTTTEVDVSEYGRLLDITATSTTLIDPEHAVAGKSLYVDTWDANARNELFGVVNHRELRATLRQETVGFLDGTAFVCYVNMRGRLTIDVGQAKRNALASVRDGQFHTTVTRLDGERSRIAISIGSAHMIDGESAPCTFTVRPAGEAYSGTLHCEDGRLVAVADVVVGTGTHSIDLGYDTKKLTDAARVHRSPFGTVRAITIR